MHPQTILHPTDFTQASLSALEQAVALAREWGARLVILHAAPPRGAPRDRSGLPAVASPQQLRDEIRRRASPEPPPAAEFLVSCDEPAAAIVRTAAARDCGLIVMGGDQPHGLGRLYWGSVVEQVVRWAHCPVLVVKSAPEPACRFRAPFGRVDQGAGQGDPSWQRHQRQPSTC
jgi:nucleotide-binding universal stress UspA family protein